MSNYEQGKGGGSDQPEKQAEPAQEGQEAISGQPEGQTPPRYPEFPQYPPQTQPPQEPPPPPAYTQPFPQQGYNPPPAGQPQPQQPPQPPQPYNYPPTQPSPQQGYDQAAAGRVQQPYPQQPQGPQPPPAYTQPFPQQGYNPPPAGQGYAPPPGYNQPPQGYGQYPGAPPPGYQPPYPAQTNVRKSKAPVWLFVILGLIALCVIGGIIAAVSFFSIARSTTSQVGEAFSNLATELAVTETAVSIEIDATYTAIANDNGSLATLVAPTDTAEAGIDTPVPETAPTPTSSSSDSGEATKPPSSGQAMGAVGQTQEVDGLKITVDSVRYETSGFIPPQEGNEYLVIAMVFENTTAEEKTVSSLLSLSVRDESGQSYTIALGAEKQDSADGSVPPNGTLRGESAFEVPKTAKGLELEYDPIFGGDPVRWKLDR